MKKKLKEFYRENRFLFAFSLLILVVVIMIVITTANFNARNKESDKKDTPTEEVEKEKSQRSLNDMIYLSRQYLESSPDVTTAPLPAFPAPKETTSSDSENKEKTTETDKTDNNPAYRPLVVIDPGHQKNADTTLEKIAPWSDEKKYKVTGGATGNSTGVKEYELMLEIAKMLKSDLELKNFEVILTRSRNDVNISNQQRAKVANTVGANMFLRLHANSSTDESLSGALAICQPRRQELEGIYQQSKTFAEIILNTYCENTGIENLGVRRRSDITGLNWSKAPAVLIELGFLSNPGDEAFLTSGSGKREIVRSISRGIEKALL